MKLLEIRNLSKYFSGLEALSNVDFAIDQGEIRGLIGPNGAGKTTLFNVISGVFHPTSGRVIFKGGDIAGLKPHVIAKMGIVRTFQASTMFKNFSVLRNVIAARHIYSKVNFWGAVFNTPATREREKENEKKAIEILEFMDLSEYKDELSVSLPHGHQRALGVSIALAAEPELLMLDEPVTGMNDEEIVRMMSLIKKIQDTGVTVLLIEHHMKAVMNLCERIVVLDFGKKIAEGSPDEIKENEDVIKAYLGGG